MLFFKIHPLTLIVVYSPGDGRDGGRGRSGERQVVRMVSSHGDRQGCRPGSEAHCGEDRASDA